jgi:hypothetical protein
MFICDEIISIKKIGKRRTIDISTDGNNLFLANDILTHNSGFGDAEIELTSISDSIGTAATADIIIGVTQTDDLRKMGKYVWIILKNRYGLNKIKITVSVDYYKMRVYEDEESKPEEISSSLSKIPPNEKEKKKEIDETTEIVKSLLNKDTSDKFKKMISFDE